MTRAGPFFWGELEEVMEKIPCPDCRNFGLKAIRALHDVVNADLGKPIHDPRNLAQFSGYLVKAMRICHKSGSCPTHREH